MVQQIVTEKYKRRRQPSKQKEHSDLTQSQKEEQSIKPQISFCCLQCKFIRIPMRGPLMTNKLFCQKRFSNHETTHCAGSGAALYLKALPFHTLCGYR
jgi:hypothetical protein